jgi:hypothetical protein
LIWHAGAVLSGLSRGATIVAAVTLLAPRRRLRLQADRRHRRAGRHAGRGQQFGKAGNPAKGFVSNPTSCAVATTTIDAVAYDGTRGSGSASFTPTGCDKLAFAPTIAATLDPGAKG